MFFCFAFSNPVLVFIYCIKTLLPISTHVLSSVLNFLGAFVFALQKNISVHGPQGPVSPAGPHQLSFFGSNAIFSFGIPNESHIFSDSSSFGASLSPSKHV